MQTKGWVKTAAWFGMFLFLLAGICLAADQAAAAAPAAAPVWKGILMGAINGAIVGVVGYFSQSKNPDGSHEDFDVRRCVGTIIVGLGIGAFAAWKGKTFDSVEAWVENSGYVATAELVLKMIWRNGPQGFLSGLLGAVKGGAGNPPSLPAPSAAPSKPS